MPQADNDLRERMNDRFGSHTDEAGPTRFLQDAGYVLNRDWTWSKAGVGDLDQMTRDEFECLMFLVHEWDYGALSAAAEKPSISETFSITVKDSEAVVHRLDASDHEEIR